MGYIIGLLGMAKAGKDETAKKLLELGFKRYAFGDEVKIELAEKLNIPVENLHNHNKEKYREDMISYGEGKRKENPNYWINRVKNQVEEDIKNGRNVVITDIRRVSEIDFIMGLKNIYGKDNVFLVEISRPYENGGQFDNDIETTKALIYASFFGYTNDKLINSKDSDALHQLLLMFCIRNRILPISILNKHD